MGAKNLRPGAALAAQRMGLVQEIVPPGNALDRAIEVAEILSTYPQPAMRADRRAALASFALGIEDGLRFEVEAHRESMNDPAMAKWLERFASGERPQPIRPPQ